MVLCATSSRLVVISIALQPSAYPSVFYLWISATKNDVTNSRSHHPVTGGDAQISSSTEKPVGFIGLEQPSRRIKSGILGSDTGRYCQVDYIEGIVIGAGSISLIRKPQPNESRQI